MPDVKLTEIEAVDPRRFPETAIIQLRMADQLHTLTGGEALWAIHNVATQNCPRCMNFAAKLMKVAYIWPEDN